VEHLSTVLVRAWALDVVLWREHSPGSAATFATFRCRLVGDELSVSSEVFHN
jgi:hypothetical protein